MKKSLILVLIFIFVPLISKAGLVEDLQKQIDAKKPVLEQLKAQSAQLEQQIQETVKTENTLNSTIKVLDTTQKKLSTDLKVTENKIYSTNLSITQIGEKIRDQEDQISVHSKAISAAIRKISEAESNSIASILLESGSLSDVWKDVDSLDNLQNSLRNEIAALTQANKELNTQINQKTKKKTELVNLKEDLAVQKQSVDINKKSKAELLAITKSQEATYQKLLADNRAREKQFEDELYAYESQLKIAIDPSLLPTKRPGVLSWPLDLVYITQRFGKTVGASRLYASGSHNGVDFRATVGTPVRAVLSGTITGTGNTDEQRGCYSYGRWILIKHDNGLSSIYGHLSASRVSAGQHVNTGDVIGLSGGAPGMFGSGFSTGQHLHLGLFATQGVTIKQFVQSKGCKQMFLPIADSSAYLDPLAYLPSL
ncbi:MAG: peptidoglycan DD-metalloendopeptidase family protein [Minisyncoccia bacterium]